MKCSDDVATEAVLFGLAMTTDGSHTFMEVHRMVAAVQVPAESASPVPHLAMGLIVTEAVITAAESICLLHCRYVRCFLLNDDNGSMDRAIQPPSIAI